MIGYKNKIEDNEQIIVYVGETNLETIIRSSKTKLSIYYFDLLKESTKRKITSPNNHLTFKHIKLTLLYILKNIFIDVIDNFEVILSNSLDIENTVYRELSKYNHEDINMFYKIISVKEKFLFRICIERYLPEYIYKFHPLVIWTPKKIIEECEIDIEEKYLYDFIPKEGIFTYELIAKLTLIPFIKKDKVDDLMLILRDNLIWFYGPNDNIEETNSKYKFRRIEKKKRFDNYKKGCLYDYLDNTSYSEKVYLMRGGVKSSKAAEIFINNSECINVLKQFCKEDLLLRNIKNSWLMHSYPRDLPFILCTSESEYITKDKILFSSKKINPPEWFIIYYNEELPEIINENINMKPCEIYNICKEKYQKQKEFLLYNLCIRDSILEQYCELHKNEYIQLYQKIKGNGHKERVDKIVKLITIKMDIIYINHPIYNWITENLIQ